MAGKRPTPWHWLRRALALWGIAARMDFLFLTQNPALALGWYVTDMISSTASITAVFLLAERFAGIGPWSQSQVVFMLGYATLVWGLQLAFFGFNVIFISRRIGRGQLDHSLVQPQPLWLALMTDGFMPFSSAAILLPGVGLLIWAGAQLGLALTPGWLALF